jgi:hypothetical protein
MNPDYNAQSYLLNQYRQQDILESARRERLAASLPRRAGRLDALLAHLGRGMVAVGQRMQRQTVETIDAASLNYPLPAFDRR